MRLTASDARAWSASELHARLERGSTFPLDAVTGWIYRGTSLGLPAWIERLTWTKFAKAFHRDGDHVRGWNIRIEQDGLDHAWRPKLRRGRAVTFGPFVVVESAAGVLLDYGLGGGAMRALRDPLVALDPAADVLLGRSLLQIGPASIPTPSYFLLERDARVIDPRS